MTVLATNVATGAHEITRQQGDTGTGTPPHRHTWDESFYVVAGALEFTCSGKTVLCPPGTLVHVPAGTLHSFRYLVDGCDILEMTGHGGNATKMFTAVSNELASGPLEIPKLLAVVKEYGADIPL